MVTGNDVWLQREQVRYVAVCGQMHGCVLWKVATFLFHSLLFLIFLNLWEELSIIYLLALFDCSFNFYGNISGRLWKYRKRRRWPASCISYILYHIFDITYHTSYIIYHVSYIIYYVMYCWKPSDYKAGSCHRKTSDSFTHFPTLHMARCSMWLRLPKKVIKVIFSLNSLESLLKFDEAILSMKTSKTEETQIGSSLS